MYLKDLKLINFKNFEAKTFQFSSNINCIVGNNGKGKTNILDAIYYLAYCKSYFNHKDAFNIKFNEDFFSIEGNYIVEENEDAIFCAYKKGEQKVFKKNSKSYSKLSNHIGCYPTVIISPFDRDLILEGSEVRRKFIDLIISQSNKNYLDLIIRYNKVLQQRNSLLKYFFIQNKVDLDSIFIYDYELEKIGSQIHKYRILFIEEFKPHFTSFYALISDENEQVDLIYDSQLNTDTFSNLLKDNFQKDKVAQYTTKGTHKDDLQFLLNQNPIKIIGSQGQQKTYLIALKLAHFQFLKNKSEKTPIMLLDDIFDKLDENRVEKLIKLVNENGNFGQIFITDTHKERTKNIVSKINKNFTLLEL